jgi:glycosyltransferase involved in cell wall biosynthesis
MKIVVNTRLLLRGKLDGIGWFTHELMSRIVRSHPEHEFHFIFDRPYSDEFLFASNVKAHVLPPPARHPLLFRIWYDWMMPWKLNRLKPDVFVSPDMMISTRTKTPQVVVLHDLNFEHHPEDLPAPIARYLRKMTPRFARHAKTIVTVSEFSKQDIMAQYHVPEEKVRVVYNGVQDAFQPLSDDQKVQAMDKWAGGCKYFVFVSSIHPRKNLKRLLEAYELFRERHSERIKLVAVGRMFWKNEDITATLSSMKYAEDIVFTGHLETQELTHVIGAAHALMYVSYFEGFGVPIVEAFKCGIPVVTANVTAMPEVAGDAALLVDPFSVGDIAGAMRDVSMNEELRDRLIKRGYKRAEAFDWNRSAREFWQIIESCAQRN